LILVGFFCCPPLLWTVCILCLSGDIYNNRLGSDGYLTTWSWGNKIAAVIILLLQAGGLAFQVWQAFQKAQNAGQL
jgi:hypothetical protein